MAELIAPSMLAAFGSLVILLSKVALMIRLAWAGTANGTDKTPRKTHCAAILIAVPQDMLY